MIQKMSSNNSEKDMERYNSIRKSTQNMSIDELEDLYFDGTDSDDTYDSDTEKLTPTIDHDPINESEKYRNAKIKYKTQKKERKENDLDYKFIKNSNEHKEIKKEYKSAKKSLDRDSKDFIHIKNKYNKSKIAQILLKLDEANTLLSELIAKRDSGNNIL